MRPDEELPLTRLLSVNEDVRRELAHHLAERQKELEAQGWSPAEAATEARRSFGDLSAVEEECRAITRRVRKSVRRAESLESWRQDLVLAWRLLLKSPAFTLAAVLTLALGIGANAAIFSVVNGTLLKPLPYDHPERLMDLAERHEHGWGNVSWANMLDWRAQSHSFDGMASYGRGHVTALTSQGPLTVWSASVSEDFFRLFPVQPVRGRLPSADEHRVGANPVAVVSYDFWRNRLGAPTDLTGERIRIDHDYQVIGVLPQGFSYPRDAEVWSPLEIDQQPTSRTAHNWSSIGRLRAGVGVADAERELDTLTARMAKQDGPDFDATGSIVTPLQDKLTSSTRAPLYLLLGASALLLLAACTNLASSMLARGITRRQEIAVRIALGAGRLRIVRQLFTESLLLALLGSGAGLLVARWALGVFLRLAPPALRLAEVHLDGWVLGFTALVGGMTTVLVGLFPALKISGVSPG
ncbi:MAG TPA: ABC transporter permease, partial [Gemmatimonadales bacterium]|nr:ABC transporter permease [Gemmatimonadales bacterium]